MISATLLAILTAAAPGEAPSASVFLKAPAAAQPSCRATRVDDQLVRVPLFSASSEECPVASVAGDIIVLRDLAQALEVEHLARSPRTPVPAKQPTMDFTPALERLIATRLIVLEARDMRLDADPEFGRAIEDFKASRQRAMIQRIAAKDVKPDAAEVERLYRGAVREWKVKSVLFEKEDAAKAFEAALRAGQGFDALVKKLVAEKKATGGGPAEFVSRKHALPEVVEELEKAKRGVPTGLVKVSSGWVVLRVEGTRYPANDEAARAAARAASVARVEREAVRNFYLALVKRYATVDGALLKQVDFEAKGEKGFEALLKDGRPLAKIRGDKPLTVGDLTLEVSMKFFHGIEAPIRDHRVNREKDPAFERLLGSRLFSKEAAARHLDTQPEYRRDVEEYERALAFNTLIEKVIAPDVKVTEEEATRYYEQRKADYTAPEMLKLDGAAFATGREAQEALDKLKAGTDFAWLRSSAPGQLAPERRSLHFGGTT
ncbi:MAG TPA: peptidyl-prolyl cis-trans isomerase, partial [Anaeromyxobacteraceae bacterium]